MVYNDAQLGLENLASFSDQRQGVLQCPRANMEEKRAEPKASQNRYLTPSFLSLEASKNP